MDCTGTGRIDRAQHTLGLSVLPTFPLFMDLLEIRKTKRIRFPDAIVWSTAQVHSLLLVSRNIKDFPADEPGVRVPYKV